MSHSLLPIQWNIPEDPHFVVTYVIPLFFWMLSRSGYGSPGLSGVHQLSQSPILCQCYPLEYTLKLMKSQIQEAAVHPCLHASFSFKANAFGREEKQAEGWTFSPRWEGWSLELKAGCLCCHNSLCIWLQPSSPPSLQLSLWNQVLLNHHYSRPYLRPATISSLTCSLCPNFSNVLSFADTAVIWSGSSLRKPNFKFFRLPAMWLGQPSFSQGVTLQFSLLERQILWLLSPLSPKHIVCCFKKKRESFPWKSHSHFPDCVEITILFALCILFSAALGCSDF